MTPTGTVNPPAWPSRSRRAAVRDGRRRRTAAGRSGLAGARRRHHHPTPMATATPSQKASASTISCGVQEPAAGERRHGQQHIRADQSDREHQGRDHHRATG